jgi:hypothetical protein
MSLGLTVHTGGRRSAQGVPRPLVPIGTSRCILDRDSLRSKVREASSSLPYATRRTIAPALNGAGPLAYSRPARAATGAGERRSLRRSSPATFGSITGHGGPGRARR